MNYPGCQQVVWVVCRGSETRLTKPPLITAGRWLVVSLNNSVWNKLPSNSSSQPGKVSWPRIGRFGSKVGQIGPKWDKSGAFSDQISVHLAREPNLPSLSWPLILNLNLPGASTLMQSRGDLVRFVRETDSPTLVYYALTEWSDLGSKRVRWGKMYWN